MGWEPSEFGLDGDDATSGPMTPEIAQALVGAVAMATPVSPYARRMTAVEEKITLAGYYKSLLDSELFDTDDIFTRRVETEVKDFIVKRLEALVNSQAAPAEDSFTPEEVKALKLWAKKLLAAPKPMAPAQVAAGAPVVAPAPPPQPVPVVKRRRLAKAPGKRAEAPTQAPVAKAEGAPEAPSRKRRQPAVRSPNAIPVPTGNAFTAASEMSARQQIMSNPNVQALGEHISSIKE